MALVFFLIVVKIIIIIRQGHCNPLNLQKPYKAIWIDKSLARLNSLLELIIDCRSSVKLSLLNQQRLWAVSKDHAALLRWHLSIKIVRDHATLTSSELRIHSVLHDRIVNN